MQVTAKATQKQAPPPKLRADAQRNRGRLLAAAEEVFKERGADASLDDVAKHAKVGIGTLYRHFPTREALLAAACDERLLAMSDASRVADDEHPPGQALRLYIEQLVRHATVYRGLATSLGIVLQNGTPGCQASTAEGARLLARAQRAGEIRRDLTFDDVVCLTTAVSLAAGGQPSKAKIAKLVGMFFDGLDTPSRR